MGATPVPGPTRITGVSREVGIVKVGAEIPIGNRVPVSVSRVRAPRDRLTDGQAVKPGRAQTSASYSEVRLVLD